MCEPTTYKRWKEHDDLLARAGASSKVPGQFETLRNKPEDVILDSANWLIQRLYEPDTERGSVISDEWLMTLGLLHLKNEAINWGDLGAYEVYREVHEDGEHWVVEIEEAAPDSMGLCEYIRGWLVYWGWGPVVVRAEW